MEREENGKKERKKKIEREEKGRWGKKRKNGDIFAREKECGLVE